jgi:hypothetical protein
MSESLINLGALVQAFSNNKAEKSWPFDHVIVDGFFNNDIAQRLSEEFMDYESPHWLSYDNLIENKKACNDWNKFPDLTYKVFNELTSENFTRLFSELSGIRPLYPDPGLHGGGWHCHGVGGLLNPHLDYNVHPKLNLQRVFNIIVYISPELKEEHGGHLGLWEHDEGKNQPGVLSKEIVPKFNRAVIFNTTQNSWHGMSRALTQPEGIYRKSIAVYYLKDPPEDTENRGRALFAPTESQKEDPQILEIIKLRSGVDTSNLVYVVKK